jgi:hypothetical protein
VAHQPRRCCFKSSSVPSTAGHRGKEKSKGARGRVRRRHDFGGIT